MSTTENNMHQLGSGRGLGSHDMTMPIHTNNPMICVEMQEKVNILRIIRCLIELDDVMDENEESSGWTLHQISCPSHYRYFHFEKSKTPPPFPSIGSKFNFTIMNPQKDVKCLNGISAFWMAGIRRMHKYNVSTSIYRAISQTPFISIQKSKIRTCSMG